MTNQAALVFYLSFILWLFYRDRTLRPMTSLALWIPLFWVTIIGTRPVSTWFGASSEDVDQVMPTEYLEGSPLDRNVFLILMILALYVLVMRRVNWGRILASNRWLFAFLLYFGVSILWSDFPFVSLKRWIKDLGNVLMVLVIVTEHDPALALRAVFSRYTNVAVPLSVLFIKYFPSMGRYYHRYTYESFYQGVTGNKNELGLLLLVSGLFLVWDLSQMITATGKADKIDAAVRLFLLVMVLWLMRLSHCSTALACLILGVALIVLLQSPAAKRQVRHLGRYSLAFCSLVFLVYTFPSIMEEIVHMLGRNTTLTGRTEIWAGLLKEPLDPILGSGYKSFWLVPARIEKFVVIQAHNGYLETYLNGGLAALSLLVGTIISTGNKLRREFFADDFEVFRLSFFVIALFYNWTEALFNGLSLIWFVLLATVLYFPPPAASAARQRRGAGEFFPRTAP